MMIDCYNDRTKIDLDLKLQRKPQSLTIQTQVNGIVYEGQLKQTPQINLKDFQTYLYNGQYSSVLIEFQSVKFISYDVEFTLINKEKILMEKLYSNQTALKSTIDSLKFQLALKQQSLKQVQSKLKIQQKKIAKTKVKFISNKNKNNLLQQSNIIKTPLDLQIIKCLFQPKQIISNHLIYQASTNDFSVQKFHHNCDTIPNTLVLCKTQFDHIIGGFTPIPWKSPQIQCFVTDETGSSFLFSLTNTDKLILKDQKRAVKHGKGMGPFFGFKNMFYGDFYICHEANKRQHSFAYINSNYWNENYKQNDKLMRFTGNPKEQPNFRVIQWQVYTLKFKQQQNAQKQQDQEQMSQELYDWDNMTEYEEREINQAIDSKMDLLRLMKQ